MLTPSRPTDTSSFYNRGACLFFAILTNAFQSALEILALYEQRPIGKLLLSRISTLVLIPLCSRETHVHGLVSSVHRGHSLDDMRLTGEDSDKRWVQPGFVLHDEPAP